LIRVPEAISPAEHEQLRRLAVDLPHVWHHACAPFDLKKRLLRTVLREIVVYVQQQTLRVLMHWQGGQHTEVELRRRRPGEHRYVSPPETVTLIRELALRMSDKQIAAQLNRLGIKTAKGHTWTRTRVGNFRKVHNVRNYCPEEKRACGEITLQETAERLGVSYSTVQRLIQRGQLPARQLCAKGPWIILAADVETLRVRVHGVGDTRGGASSLPPTQQTLVFPESI
jgi:excisionase family DNA binding protein